MILFSITSGSPYKTSWLGRFIFLCIILAGIAAFVFYKYDEPVPSGKSGLAADLLARKIMMSVYHDNWERTGAISWNFDNQRFHIWDRNRNYAKVSWDEYEVLINLSDKRGIAMESGKRMGFNDTKKKLEEAWEFWINDSFWLNPVSKMFDAGTSRRVVPVVGAEGLLVTYRSGGLSPGDSYLWLTNSDGLPKAWKMWTEKIPLGGVEATWDNWVTLSTGVRIATQHETSLFTIHLKDVEGATSIEELIPGDDPFASLVSTTGN